MYKVTFRNYHSRHLAEYSLNVAAVSLVDAIEVATKDMLVISPDNPWIAVKAEKI